ncbi:MAG: hypothetical protein M3506_02690 [Chloroflexota bacterium]|nr:hypothetical protein [Chloroflexota bacterium]
MAAVESLSWLAELPEGFLPRSATIVFLRESGALEVTRWLGLRTTGQCFAQERATLGCLV